MVQTARIQNADDLAMGALVPAERRPAYDRRVQALVARNAALEVIESAREEAQITKKELATETEMDASAVRKLLTADAANPTVDSFFRLCAALNIRIQATTATGSIFNLV